MATAVDCEQRQRAALGLAYVSHGGCHAVLRLLTERDPEAIWSAPRDVLREWKMNEGAMQRFDRARRAQTVERLEQALVAARLRFVAFGTAAYPRELTHLVDPPAGLFAKGDEDRLRALLRRPRVTIVGTRRASAYGIRAARDLAGAFASRGIAVISGMALGIDGRAHEAALEGGGLTVAVLGCGADVVYPPRHRGLYQALSERGLILSELPPGAPPSRWTFPNRNRLLAALGDAVIVVEGPLTSGAMQTAGQAAALGRPVFAIPGSIYADNHRGCNQLLRDGAAPALDPGATVEDFLAQTRIERGERSPDQGPPAGRRVRGTDPFRELAVAGREVILDAITERACSIDALVARTGISARHITAALAELELVGLAARAGPGLFIRAP
jgi:DNA processing protein